MIGARRRIAADALVIAGGAALVGSAFVHWIASGAGSRLRGHALIDAIIAVGRHLPGMSSAHLTVVWYLVPALGAASWIAAGMRGADSGAARVIAVASVLAAVGSAGAFGWAVGFKHLGPGAWLAVLGAAALVLGSWVVAPSRVRGAASVRMADRGR